MIQTRYMDTNGNAAANTCHSAQLIGSAVIVSAIPTRACSNFVES